MKEIHFVLKDFLETDDKETLVCRLTAISEGHSIQEADNCMDADVGCRNCPFLEHADSEIEVPVI